MTYSVLIQPFVSFDLTDDDPPSVTAIHVDTSDSYVNTYSERVGEVIDEDGQHSRYPGWGVTAKACLEVIDGWCKANPGVFRVDAAPLLTYDVEVRAEHQSSGDGVQGQVLVRPGPAPATFVDPSFIGRACSEYGLEGSEGYEELVDHVVTYVLLFRGEVDDEPLPLCGYADGYSADIVCEVWEAQA